MKVTMPLFKDEDMQKSFNILCALLGLSLLGACASDTEKKEPQTAEELYVRGKELMDRTSYVKAAETFEKIEIEHPYSALATKAKIMGAYAYYKKQQYDDAVMSLDRFIKFHPGNKDIAYAYYLKSLCFYEQITDIDRDQSNTQKAQDALKQVILRFPDSEYAVDAKNKLALTYDHLAGQEMEIGRWYLSQNNYLSALNRFTVVVNEYQTTSHIEEALYRQVEVYTILGLNKEAGDSLKVLGMNYPDGKWYKRAQKLKKS